MRARTAAPKHFRRPDEDCSTMHMRERAEPDMAAERAFLTDHCAAIAGDVAAIELKWKDTGAPACAVPARRGRRRTSSSRDPIG